MKKTASVEEDDEKPLELMKDEWDIVVRALREKHEALAKVLHKVEGHMLEVFDE